MRLLRRLFARLRRRPLRTVSGQATLDLLYGKEPIRGTITWTAVDTAVDDPE